MQDVPTRIGGLGLTERIEGIVERLPSRRVQVLTGALILAGIALVFLLNGGAGPNPATERTATPRHPAAVAHVPGYVASPDSPDILLGIMAAVLVGGVLATGVLFFWLHSLPERLVHKSAKVHLDIVAVLALLSLFTHVHLFWVAALLVALVKIPDFSFFSRHLESMTVSLDRIADAQPKEREASSPGSVGATTRDERESC
jgi:hypothetical protein